MKQDVPVRMRPIAAPETIRLLVLRNEANEEIRSAYNKVFDMYHLHVRPLSTSTTFPVLEEANRVVGKWSPHLLLIEAAARLLLSSTLDLARKAMEEMSARPY